MTDQVLEKLTDLEILEAAKLLNEAKKAELAEIEEARKDDVLAMIGQVFDLGQDMASVGIEKDLIKKAKSKDFLEYIISKKGEFVNVAEYDGLTLTTYKADGSKPTVKSLPYKIFVSRYKCNFEGFDEKAELLTSFEDFTPSDLFESRKTNRILNFKSIASGSIETNLGTILDNKLQIAGLKDRNKGINTDKKSALKQAKLDIKAAAKKTKEDAAEARKAAKVKK
jgi:hypothetical protein